MWLPFSHPIILHWTMWLRPSNNFLSSHLILSYFSFHYLLYFCMIFFRVPNIPNESFKDMSLFHSPNSSRIKTEVFLPTERLANSSQTAIPTALSKNSLVHREEGTSAEDIPLRNPTFQTLHEYFWNWAIKFIQNVYDFPFTRGKIIFPKSKSPKSFSCSISHHVLSGVQWHQLCVCVKSQRTLRFIVKHLLTSLRLYLSCIWGCMVSLHSKIQWNPGRTWPVCMWGHWLSSHTTYTRSERTLLRVSWTPIQTCSAQGTDSPSQTLKLWAEAPHSTFLLDLGSPLPWLVHLRLQHRKQSLWILGMGTYGNRCHQ